MEKRGERIYENESRIDQGGGGPGQRGRLRLHRAGYLVAMTDLAEPTAIRWTVSFCPAILQGTAMVEDVRGRLAKGEADALAPGRRGRSRYS